MDYKEIFGNELAEKIEGIIKEKGISLIVDNKEKPEYIPKSRFDEVIGSKNELKSQVSELANQLETLKKSAQGNDNFIKQIEDLQNKNNNWEKKYKDALLQSAIKVRAISEKAKDVDDLFRFIDLESLIIDDNGDINGLEDQISLLKEKKSYLFDNKLQSNSPPVNPASGGRTSKKAELIEQYNIAQKSGNVSKMFSIEAQIKKLKE